MDSSKLSRKRNSHLKWSTAPTSSSKPWTLLFVSSLLLSQSMLVSGYVLQEEYQANGHEDTVNLNSVNSTRSPRDVDGYEDPSHLNSVNSTRSRRDAAEFTAAVENLQHLARISNAISLQTGLSTETIPLDDFIAEILHMGDVKIDEIAGLDETKINGFITDLKNLSKNTPSNEVTDIENRLISLENIKKKAASFNDFSTFPGKEEFLADLGNLTDLKTVKTGVTDLKDHVSSLKNELGSLRGRLEANVDDKNINDVVMRLNTVFLAIGDVEKAAKSLDLDKLGMVRNIGEKPTFIDLFLAENEFRDQLKDPDYTQADDVWKNFESVYAFAKQSTESYSNFETIKKLIANRRKQHGQTFLYTAGFPHGSSDLKRLRRAVSRDFIKNHITNGEIISKSLKNAFENFEDLAEDLGKVEDVWENPSKSKSIDEITNAISLLSRVSSIPHAVDLAKKLKACQDPVDDYPVTDIKPVDELNVLVNNLKTELKKISKFEYISKFTDLKEHKDEFFLEGKSQEDQIKLAQIIMDKYGPSQKSLTAFETELATFLDDLITVEKVIDNLPTLTSPIKLKQVEVYHFVVIYYVNYFKMYECLAGISEDTSPVKKMIEVLRDLRQTSIPAGTRRDFESIINSKKSLNTVKTTAENLKKVETFEVTTMIDSFKSIEASDSISYNLGMGVQGLAAIEKVFKFKSSFEPFLGIGQNISEHSGNLTKEQNENLVLLSEVSRMFNDIDNFLQESPQGFRRKRDANFESVSKIFDDVPAKIKGVQVDMRHVVEGLQVLHNLDPTTFDDPSADLKTLDLDLSKFNFGNAKASLSKMDDFFMDYVKKMTATTPAPPTPPPAITPPPPSLRPSSEPTASELEDPKSGAFRENHPIVYVLLLILVYLW
ncbi:hypothetical protein CAEBREN_21420 [Caenorhabditis brenneri]|uniref:Domain of unknown function WSN domain-containing protein n=1 Tax=Caenorhabditis brenneri TaxID=135651 RepID=G0N666_CAEBE|nr:hypothetical protein CAEBREN_21420 [Caenorhabditis brenneri]